MEEAKNRHAILIAAAIILAPRVGELKDSPALRAAVNDAIRVAEFIARVIEKRYETTASRPARG